MKLLNSLEINWRRSRILLSHAAHGKKMSFLGWVEPFYLSKNYGLCPVQRDSHFQHRRCRMGEAELTRGMKWVKVVLRMNHNYEFNGENLW